jgi:predicted transcriptional regulator
MARTKKLVAPVTLFAAIEQEQHAALRQIAFAQRRSLADVTRTALQEFIKRQAAAGPRRGKQLSRRSA